jgi:hypothetical protein
MLILFKNLPLDGTKESYLLLRPELNLDVIVNTSVFILPLGGDLFKVGLLTIGKINLVRRREAGINRQNKRNY